MRTYVCPARPRLLRTWPHRPCRTRPCWGRPLARWPAAAFASAGDGADWPCRWSENITGCKTSQMSRGSIKYDFWIIWTGSVWSGCNKMRENLVAGGIIRTAVRADQYCARWACWINPLSPPFRKSPPNAQKLSKSLNSSIIACRRPLSESIGQFNQAKFVKIPRQYQPMMLKIIQYI